MAKKVTGYIKLQIPAGKATPAPPVGPALENFTFSTGTPNLSFGIYQSTTSIPILLAVPEIMLIAASRDAAFRSFIFSSAIS